MSKRITKAAVLLLIMCMGLMPVPVNAVGAITNIKVAVNCHFPPFQFIDENNRIAGLHIDIMNQIAAKEDLNIEYIAFDENSKAVEALENGLVDIVLGTLSGKNTNMGLRTTNVISSANLCMLVDNDILNTVLHPELDPLRYNAAFELDTISLSQLSGLNLMSTIIVGNQTQLFNALTEKSVNAVIGVKESMLYMLEREGAKDRYTIAHNYIGSVNYSMLTRKNDRVLFNSLNRSINSLRASGSYEKLYDKWVANIELEEAQEFSRKMLQYIYIFVCVALVIISFIGYLNYRLKRTVEEKTSEIRSRVHQLENESMLRERLIECSPGGIMLLKENGEVLTMNSIAREIAGIDENDSGQEISDIRDMNILGELWEHMASEGRTSEERPSVIKLGSSAENRIFRCQCHGINRENDKVLLVEDITREEEEKQERFEARKSKALNRVIAGMAHEIKNPLMSISTFASLIRQQGNDQDFQLMFAQHVPREVERMNRLIELLINYARPTRSRKECVSVAELIDDSAYFAFISSKDRRINYKIDASLKANIFVNRDQIKQALVNLIMNSIQSVEEKLSKLEGIIQEEPVIKVSGSRRNSQICIEVYDEGCGMTENELEKCMEPFFTTKASGLGMGLALTQQFVYDNSGKLEFESGKNEYTVIRMIFEEDIAYEAPCSNY